MDKTIQRGDLGKNGILFKIVPMHYEMKPSDHNFISCWYKPLPKWLPRAGQSVIPTNLSEFKVGKSDINNNPAEVAQGIDLLLDLVNKLIHPFMD